MKDYILEPFGIGGYHGDTMEEAWEEAKRDYSPEELDGAWLRENDRF